MFSKAIFKQTLKANIKLWAIFTAIISVFLFIMIAAFDPKMIQGLMDMMGEAMGDMSERFSAMMGENSMFASIGTLVGSLSTQFYSMIATIMPMIYILITANGLVAAKVDRGSMAYLLSTPTKRTKVVGTQAIYLVSSTAAMFLVVTLVGMLSVQIYHHGIFGTNYTDDVKAVAIELNVDKEEVSDNLQLILQNPDAIKAGAEARGIDESVYTMYLNLKIADATEISDSAPAMAPETQSSLSNPAMSPEMQNGIMEGLTAAAEVLNVDVSTLANDMSKMKTNTIALDAAVTASGVPQEMFVMIIDSQLAAKELSIDKGVDFNMKDYLMLNLGCFLLMFAIGSISFLFSCIFNLSENALALGAGIPLAFFIFQIMSQVSDSLSGFKYVSLNTLYDTAAITGNGTYGLQFAVLAIVGLALYTTGIKVFKEKDLPL
ncbi:MAG: hypothetical protein LBC41_17395 [Clostridiales bacterium]|nr:hypothetical protein [Clostridiales bacterium]